MTCHVGKHVVAWGDGNLQASRWCWDSKLHDLRGLCIFGTPVQIIILQQFQAGPSRLATPPSSLRTSGPGFSVITFPTAGSASAKKKRPKSVTPTRSAQKTHSAKLQRLVANSLGGLLVGLLHAKTQSKDIQSGLDASCGHHDTEKLTVTCRPLQPHNQPPGPQGHGKNWSRAIVEAVIGDHINQSTNLLVPQLLRYIELKRLAKVPSLTCHPVFASKM